MENLDAIIENFKRLSTSELLLLAQKPAELRKEVIPHLQSALLTRDKKEEAILLSEFLVNRPRLFNELSKEELTELIKQRIDSGENLESIKLDLKDNGVEMFDILNNETVFQNKTFDYLSSLKNEGLEETEIDEKMKAAFNLSDTEADIIKRQLRTKGMQNLIIGYSLLFIVVILIIASFAIGGNITIGAILLLALGIWRIFKGYEQRK
ncbi:MAG: hypothetical protein QM791_05370 [Ferruginibacter sp.]